MGQTEAAFDRALGAHEDRLLNNHIAEEDRYQDAYDAADSSLWKMKLGDIYEHMPNDLVKQIDLLTDQMVEALAIAGVEGTWVPN